MARIPLVRNKEDIAPEHYPLFEELAALRGFISGPSTVVLNSPPLAKPWNEVSEYLHRKSIVDDPSAELAVMVTARERDCRYVWSAHVRIGRRVGVSEAAIAAARDKAPTAGLSEHEAAVIDYARELLQQNRVSQPVFDQLLAGHGAPWLVELTGWIGRYGALSGIINAFEVPADPDSEPMPAVPSTTPPTGKAVPPPLAQPRITPVTAREQVAPEHREIFDYVMQSRGGVRGPFALLMQSPPLCKVLIDVDAYFRTLSPVDGAARELAILATAREKDCRYVWGAHAPTARTVGVSEASLDVVRTRGATAALPGDQRDIVDYVRQLLHDSRITQDLFDRMRERHGVPWLVELTCLVGQYGILAGELNAFEMAPDPDREQLPLG